MAKLSITKSLKITFTGLNITAAARIASKSGMYMAREEMLINGIYIVPTNNEKEHCFIYSDKSEKKTKTAMWCPSLDDLISNDWVVFK
ncbi:MW1434 family type I TA system toxin [Erysipelothrix anatis]|uniref:Thoeris anti-defense Tad2 family protein n=1 Tax=Erysipelothrix anatis TaxID=2683713 RepID=UPI00135C6FF4|nr:MW1434 family type I TA system toxin [Erysipelothrix anatis]